MAPGFIPWLSRLRIGRIVMHLVVATFIFVTLSTFVRASAPVPPTWRKSFPWAMFHSPSSRSKRLVVTGRLKTGETVKIDPRKYFHYKRGATDLRVYDHARSLGRKGRRNPKAVAFAHYLVERIKEDGQDLAFIELRWERRKVYGNRKRQKPKYEPIIELQLSKERPPINMSTEQP